VSDGRHDWPVQPIASGILTRSLTDGTLDDILLAELQWLVLPALLLAALCRWWRSPYIDLAKGQS